MLDLSVIANATVPVLMVLMVGYIFGRIGLIDKSKLATLNRYAYVVAQPALVLRALANTNIYTLQWAGVLVHLSLRIFLWLFFFLCTALYRVFEKLFLRTKPDIELKPLVAEEEGSSKIVPLSSQRPTPTPTPTLTTVPASAEPKEPFLSASTLTILLSLWMPSSWTNNIILGLPILHDIYGTGADAYSVLPTFINLMVHTPMVLAQMEIIKSLKPIPAAALTPAPVPVPAPAPLPAPVPTVVDLSSHAPDGVVPPMAVPPVPAAPVMVMPPKLTPGKLAKKLVKEVFKSPLIIAAIVGLCWSFTGQKLPTILDNFIHTLAEATLGLSVFNMGLFMLASTPPTPRKATSGEPASTEKGYMWPLREARRAGSCFSKWFWSLMQCDCNGACCCCCGKCGGYQCSILPKGARLYTVFATFTKLLGCIPLSICFTWLFGLEGLPARVTSTIACVPCAMSMFTITKEYDTGAQLAFGAIILTTVLWPATLIFQLWIFDAFNIFPLSS
ncbi:hypothetical protein PAPYR_2925 [Paratrimastix pyriformis]|uniref:Auxin efflux carrier n=1 Tax=Paratrimastix pyriformis TaxID=342808 RepID=A0ABQ8USJ6_9EUKA|nr:hypothetical protein PAPYR_2925 [Paratrimastix pyriformis]